MVFPEALLGGYPQGLDFGAVVGHRSEAGKAMFVRYFKGAVACPGAETEMLAEWDRKAQGAAAEASWRELYARYQKAYPDLAAEFDLPVALVKRSADSGELPVIRAGNRRYVRRSDATMLFGKSDGSEAA